MSDGYPGPHGRRRALELGVLDALVALGSLPYAELTMTGAQLGQVQKVLDAAVVNPALEKEYDTLMRQAIVDPELVQDYQRLARYSPEGYAPFETQGRDPNMVRRANQLLEERIAVTEADKRVRLDFARLLTPGALKPTTDNPDEASFLVKVRHTLFAQGVWLRFELKPDKRTLWAWLSIGPYGGTPIPTKDGRITRDSLMIGPFVMGYYDQVVKGKVQSALDNAIRLVDNEIDNWEILHRQEESARVTAAPGVVFTSDHLGGANYPSIKIWDAPDQLLQRAKSENNSGKLKAASKTIVLAALATRLNAKRLDQYIDDEMKGAGRAVKTLGFVAKAGKIAGDILIVTGAFGALTRFLGAEAADAGLRAAAERELTAGPPPPRALPPGDPPPRALPPGNPNPNYYRGGPAAYANTESGLPFARTEQRLNAAVNDLQTGASVADQVVVDRARARLTFGDLDADLQQQITGWLDEFERLATAGRGGDYVLSLAELDGIYDQVVAQWGTPGF